MGLNWHADLPHAVSHFRREPVYVVWSRGSRFA
jgi:hypothetical protein